ncbi:MAG: hypothetical protein HY815_20770 [Candidatus Riflebacteria bacterium]|nr:hypothetical protein [Candidatus Riflebacteria bacterium]
MADTYTLLDGTRVDLTGISPGQRLLIEDIPTRIADGISYTDLLTLVFHPLSPLWDGKPPHEALARGPLMKVLPDLCARLAIETSHLKRDFIPVSEFARIRRVSRQAIYDAVARGELSLDTCGKVGAIVVDARCRRWQPSRSSQEAGRIGARKRKRKRVP